MAITSKFSVEITGYRTLHELPNYWTAKKFADLLEVMEFGDSSALSDQEVRDMCLMALSENEPEVAAGIILEYVFGEELNKGQIDNLSHEMLNEKMWEEYAEISMHEKFFNSHQILFDAYNGKFPNTEALTFNLKISTTDSNDLKIFKQPTAESAVVRLIVKGMPENTLINRLYKDEIASESFPEAKHIIWDLNLQSEDSNELNYSLLTSTYFFKDLKYVEQFEGSTHQDKEQIVDED